jgi:hypothetical protein
MDNPTDTSPVPTNLSSAKSPDASGSHRWARRSALGLVAAAAAAAAISLPFVLGEGDDSTAPEPPAGSSGADPSPEGSDAFDLDLDGDGDADRATVTGATGNETWLVEVTFAGTDPETSELTIEASEVDVLGVTDLGAAEGPDVLALAVTTKRGAEPQVVTWTPEDGVVLAELVPSERLVGRGAVTSLHDGGLYVWRPSDAGPNELGEVPVDVITVGLDGTRLVNDSFDIRCLPAGAAPDSFPQECEGPVGAEGEILPVPLDLEGVVADLDGDGRDDELHVDTFPNTDGVTTSYEVWAKLTSTGRTVSGQMTGETPNYVSFKGVVDTDGDGRNEVVLGVTPGGDLGTSHVYGLVGRQLQLLEWPDDTTTLDIYESGSEAGNVWIVGDRLLSGTTTNGGGDWQMWEWRWDGSMLRPTSLGTRCGEDPATTPPLGDC